MLRNMTETELNAYMDENPTLTSESCEVPLHMLNENKLSHFWDLDAYALTAHADGYIAGYKDATGRKPMTKTVTLTIDTAYGESLSPLADVVVVKRD